MVGSATLTTVASSATTAEPSTAPATIHLPDVSAIRTVPAAVSSAMAEANVADLYCVPGLWNAVPEHRERRGRDRLGRVRSLRRHLGRRPLPVRSPRLPPV